MLTLTLFSKQNIALNINKKREKYKKYWVTWYTKVTQHLVFVFEVHFQQILYLNLSYIIDDKSEENIKENTIITKW